MLQDGYEENGDSENVARVKAENALVPIFALTLNALFLQHM